MSLEMIKRTTLTEMCNVWQQSRGEIVTAFKMLVDAEARLKAAFKPDSYLFNLSRQDSRYRNYEKPEELIKELKKDVWRSIIDRIELRRVLSIKKASELDRQLESGDGLPDIDEVQILAMLDGMADNVNTFLEDAVKEIFEWLRPPRSKLKTNSEFEIGKRVIKRYVVRRRYSSTQGYTVNYNHEKELRALDNVFHMLDGKGTVKTHRGPLIDAIEATGPDGKGETEYFRFKCYNNCNFHIEFKRLDLVTKLNAVAGGMRLKPGSQTT